MHADDPFVIQRVAAWSCLYAADMSELVKLPVVHRHDLDADGVAPVRYLHVVMINQSINRALVSEPLQG